MALATIHVKVSSRKYTVRINANPNPTELSLSSLVLAVNTYNTNTYTSHSHWDTGYADISTSFKIAKLIINGTKLGF